jgi:hypothetical protein
MIAALERESRAPELLERAPLIAYALIDNAFPISRFDRLLART